MPSGAIALNSAGYSSSVSDSDMSLNRLPGEIRNPTRSGPISAATASVTSRVKRIRLPIEPP